MIQYVKCYNVEFCKVRTIERLINNNVFRRFKFSQSASDFWTGFTWSLFCCLYSPHFSVHRRRFWLTNAFEIILIRLYCIITQIIDNDEMWWSVRWHKRYIYIYHRGSNAIFNWFNEREGKDPGKILSLPKKSELAEEWTSKFNFTALENFGDPQNIFFRSFPPKFYFIQRNWILISWIKQI